MFIKVFGKKFSSALLLGAMVFTTANGASVCALNDESTAKEVLAAANNNAENENGENDVAEDLGSKATGDGDSDNSVDKKEVFVGDVSSSESSNGIAPNKAWIGSVAGFAVGGATCGAVGFVGGKAKGKSGSSINSGDSNTTAGNTGSTYDERLEKLEKKLAETEKLLEDTKEEAASSLTVCDVLFGWWGLLRNKEHIGTGRVITTSIIHGIFIILAIIEIVVAIKIDGKNKGVPITSAVIEVVCPGVGLIVDGIAGMIGLESAAM